MLFHVPKTHRIVAQAENQCACTAVCMENVRGKIPVCTTSVYSLTRGHTDSRMSQTQRPWGTGQRSQGFNNSQFHARAMIANHTEDTKENTDLHQQMPACAEYYT